MEKEKKTFTLLELTTSIQRAIQKFYHQPYWVKAEMHKLNLAASGHCFPELVQKQDDKIVAQMRGTIWKTQFTTIRRKFESITKEPLKDGMELLLAVQVKFDPIYGMSVLILDIDPNYTLGELQRQREETLRKLKAQNLLNKNQLLSLALLPKNIAIISVASSKGLSDFMTVLKNNEFGYGFNTALFPAVLDGDRAVETILRQLQKIKNYISFFDAVVIVRGGGGEIGMTCYNDFNLCAEIANFPIPVLTGIGHSTNLTVAEMIAFKSAITPTQLASFFVQSFQAFDTSIQEAKRHIVTNTNELLQEAKRNVLTEFRIFRNATTSLLLSERQELKSVKETFRKGIKAQTKYQKDNLITFFSRIRMGTQILQRLEIQRINTHQQSIKTESKRLLFQQNELLQHLQLSLTNKTPFLLLQKRQEIERIASTVRLLSPENLLKKGYSISLLNGKVISEENQPKQGDLIETITAFGQIKSTTEQVTPKKSETKEKQANS